MSLNIIRGKVSRPQRIVIYAPEGLGKSTLASELPDPLFLDFEKGTHHLSVARLEPKTLKDTESILTSLIKDPQGFKTLVVDTIDWLEELVIQEVCTAAGKTGIEDFGYGKGYVVLAERFNALLGQFNDVAKHMDVVLLAHSQVKKFELPETAGAFDRYELKLSKQVGPLVKEWCDALLLANWKTKIRERDDGFATTNKAIGGKERMLFCSRTSAWDGKNRHGLKDEEPWVTPADGAKIVGRCLGNGAAGATVATKADPKPAPTEKKPPAPVSTPATAEEDTIPMEHGTHPLNEIVGANEEAVNAYMISRKTIKEGQTYRDCDAAMIAKVQKAPGPFMAQALKGTGVAA